MIAQPDTMPQYMEAVNAFARRATSDLQERYDAGERGFAIEEHFDRSKVRHDFYGRFIDITWYQDMFFRYVNPRVSRLDGVSVYADFLIIPNPFDEVTGYVIPEHNIMVYRLSVA